MKIFISWSGSRSKAVAIALRRWIPDVIQFVEPWMSETDIEAGARWGRDIEKELEETQFGIICVTKDNQNAPWLLFETGALAKTIAGTFVCPYLIEINPVDLSQGPLTQFQGKRAIQNETWELVCTINKALKDNCLPEERLKRTFDRAWPDLENALENLPAERTHQLPARSAENVTNEILGLVRGLAHATPLEARIDALTEELSYIKSGITSLLANAQLDRNTLDDPSSSRIRRSQLNPKRVMIAVEFPTSDGTAVENILISSEDDIFNTLSKIWRMLNERPSESSFHPQAYTYLWDWIIIRKQDKMPFIIRGVMQQIPALTVFKDGEQWQVVPLDEPLLNKPERFGLTRGSGDNW